MIRNSFIFLEKVSKKKEQNILKQGIKDWNGFLQTKKIKGISNRSKSYFDRKIKEAKLFLLKDSPSYFINKLPKKEMWRLYSYFKDDCCFLDIEIDSYGKVILVGISNHFETKHFVKGINLDLVENELSKYKIIVTFNGSSFDLPKLKKMDIEINLAHIDLKPLCINLNLKGGLKEVEKILNLKRPSHLHGNPVQLWKAFHASGDQEYFNLLLEYNREDCENLIEIMDYVYKEMSNKLYKQ